MQLRGCGTALVTPFRQDGSIDETALRNLVAWQVESGIDFLVPCGTTGETPTLSHDEWLQVIDITIEVVAGARPHRCGCDFPTRTREGRRKSQRSGRTTRRGFHFSPPAPITTSPHRRASTSTFAPSPKPSTSQSFLQTSLAVLAQTWNRATLARLTEIPNIAGVKEASGIMNQIAEVCNLVPENFTVLSGDDAVTLPAIALGGVGLISVASNEIPAEMSGMIRSAMNNDWNAARQVMRKFLPLMQANFMESSPLPVKAVLAMMGKIEEVIGYRCFPCAATPDLSYRKLLPTPDSLPSPLPMNREFLCL